jgi:NADH-quinone oxidoreductase subunit N
MNPQILQDLQAFHPELTITLTLLAVIVVDLAAPSIRRGATFLIAALGLLLALAFTVPLYGAAQGTLFYGMVALDHMAVFFKGFLILTSFFVLLAAPGSKELSKDHIGEFYALLLGVTLGMVLLASAADLLMLFLSLETVSLGSYVMVGYLSNQRESNEASLKYILFGAVSTGCMLYGITLLFGLTGTTKMAQIRDVIAQGAGSGNNSLTLLVAVVLILAGFGFKTAAVPFHFWCPDVYTGAPTPVTAFLSVAPKAAGFATLIRFFFTGLSRTSVVGEQWGPFAAVNWTLLVLMISVVTMTLGNIAALRQENMKRMLAYSSIAHAGYILMGPVVLSPLGLQAVLVYLITYLFMNLGAFLVVIEIYNRTGSFDLKDYRGLWRRSPFLTISMTIFMLSLMGIPPLAGFFGKLYVFAAAVNQNLAWYAVVGAVNSVVAVYYYARVIKAMIIDASVEGVEGGAIRLSWTSQVLVWIMLLPTAGLMLFWNYIQQLTGSSMKLFFG